MKVAQTVVLKRKFSVKKDVAFGKYAVLNFRFLASAISQNFLRAFRLTIGKFDNYLVELDKIYRHSKEVNIL